jgi:TPR repeat protein
MRSGLLRTVLCCLVGGALAGPAMALDLVVTHEGARAAIQGQACGPHLRMEVEAPNPSFFAGDRIEMQKLLSGARSLLQFECADVTQLEIIGREGNAILFQGHASAADNWILHAAPAVAAVTTRTALYRAKIRTPVRAAPWIRADKVTTLRLDDTIDVIEQIEAEVWLPVVRGGQQIGYVFAPSVEPAGRREPGEAEALAERYGISIADAETLLAGMQAYGAELYQQAATLLQPFAERGISEAAFRIAKMYQHGDYLPQDQAAAVRWMSLAAQDEHAAAQNDLGAYYQEGLGVPVDSGTAAVLFFRSAEQGYCWAQLNIGAFHYFAIGVDQDYVQATYWFARLEMRQQRSGLRSRPLAHGVGRLRPQAPADLTQRRDGGNDCDSPGRCGLGRWQ